MSGVRTTPSRSWTTRTDVLQALRRRWDRGEFVAALADGRPVVPLAVGLRGPTSREVADRFGDVQDWVRAWEEQAAATLRLEYGSVGGRLVGVNRVPVRVHVDEARHLWRLLGVTSRVEAIGALIERLRVEYTEYPALQAWLREHPRDLLESAAILPRAVAVVRWIDLHAGRGAYLRQIDVPGVDTKFVEQHRALLAALLDAVLPLERVDPAAPRTDLAARYGLASRPAYVRLRRLDDAPVVFEGRPVAGFSELTVRVADLVRTPVEAARVVVVENEITYLALPSVRDTVAVLGGGYGVAQLAPLSWLADRDLVYWGDIDTHGFAILDQVRSMFPQVRSFLMDRSTLEAHEAHWGVEASARNRLLTHLTPTEQALYRDLVEGAYRPGLRLEQERVRFGRVREAFEALDRTPPPGPSPLPS